MIVGLLILDDADIDAVEEEVTEWRAKATAPVVSAATASAGRPSTDTGDPTLSCSIGRDGSSDLQGRFKGAKILGLE